MNNPWVGLRPFSQSERDLFFGRKKEAKILGNLVATLPLLIVYAPSGTGKSSLINAGLAPELALDPSQVAVFVDTHDDVLATTRAGLEASGWSGAPPSDLATLLERHWEETERRTVVVIDQFEERLNARVPNGDLFSAMARLAHSGSDAACVVLSIREDYLGNLEPLMRMVPSLLNASYRVPPLTRGALESAVYGPVQQLSHADTRQISIDADLVERCLDDLRARATGQQEPGEQRFEPGYFQIVWSTLWDARRADSSQRVRLQLRDYLELGGAEAILKDFTAKRLNDLEPAQAHMFWAMSRYLVLPTGAKTALTVQDLTELVQRSDYMTIVLNTVHYTLIGSHAGGTWLADLSQDRRENLIRSVLAALTSSRAPLFQRVVRSNREEFELLHDLLGSILLRWREEYAEAERARAEAAVTTLERIVEPLRPSRPRSTRTDAEIADEAEAAVVAVVSRASDFLRRLRHSQTSDERLRLEGEARDLWAALAVVDMREVGVSYERKQRSRAMKREVAQAVLAVGLDDPSPVVRRAFQELIPLWASPMSISPRFGAPLTVVVARTAAAGVLGFGSSLLALALFSGPLDQTGVELPWLSVFQCALALTFVYSVLFDSRGIRPMLEGEDRDKPLDPRDFLREALAGAVLVPKKPVRQRLAALALTWPAPAVIVVGLGLLAALGFEAQHWSPTAGFNLAVLWSVLGVGVGILVSRDN